MKTGKKKFLYVFFIILILFDLAYSFNQYFHFGLDGDVVESVLPLDHIKPALNDPLGINAVFNAEKYSATNRFFSHWSYNKIMNNLPLFLQNFVSPVDSIYLSCAIFKLFVHLSILILLSVFITGRANFKKLDFILAMVLVFPLFQTNGNFRDHMGIIDKSITYVYFYAYPIMFIMLYLVPFVQKNYHNLEIKNKWIYKVLYLPLIFVICFSGPLNQGIVLVFSLVVFLYKFLDNYRNTEKTKDAFKNIKTSILNIPKDYWYYLVPICVVSLYSLYVGTFNSMSDYNVSLIERYELLPQGILNLLFNSWGYPLLIIICIFNTVIINLKYKETSEGKKILRTINWILIFILVYILLLPIGGYRPYRENIIRYDTVIPITLSLMIYYGLSSLFIIKRVYQEKNKSYLILVSSIFIFFQIADPPDLFQDDKERAALKVIIESKEDIVEIPREHCVVSWGLVKDPEHSRNTSKILKRWNIIDKEKLFYNAE